MRVRKAVNAKKITSKIKQAKRIASREKRCEPDGAAELGFDEALKLIPEKRIPHLAALTAKGCSLPRNQWE